MLNLISNKRLLYLVLTSFLLFFIVISVFIKVLYSNKDIKNSTNTDLSSSQNTLQKEVSSEPKYLTVTNIIKNPENFQFFHDTKGYYFKYANNTYNYLYSDIDESLVKVLTGGNFSSFLKGFLAIGDYQILVTYEVFYDENNVPHYKYNYYIVKGRELVATRVFESYLVSKFINNNLIIFIPSNKDATNDCTKLYVFDSGGGSFNEKNLLCNMLPVGTILDTYYFATKNSDSSYKVTYIDLNTYSSLKTLDIKFKGFPRIYEITEGKKTNFIGSVENPKMPYSTFKLYTLEGKEVDLQENLISQNLDLTKYYGLTINKAGSDEEVPLNINLTESGYELVSSSKEVKYFISKSVNSELYKSLNLAVNYELLVGQGMGVGGGGGTWSGVNLEVRDLPNGNINYKLLSLKKFYVPLELNSVISPKTYAFVGVYTYSKNNKISSASRDFAFDRFNMVYAGFDIMTASDDLSSFTFRESGGDGSGGGEKFSRFSNYSISTIKEFGAGSVKGDEMIIPEYSGKEALIYYAKMSKYLVSENPGGSENNILNFENANDFLLKNNVSNCNTWKSFSQIRVLNINNNSDSLILDLQKYYNPSVDYLVNCYPTDYSEGVPKLIYYFGVADQKSGTLLRLLKVNYKTGETDVINTNK